MAQDPCLFSKGFQVHVRFWEINSKIQESKTIQYKTHFNPTFYFHLNSRDWNGDSRQTEKILKKEPLFDVAHLTTFEHIGAIKSQKLKVKTCQRHSH